MKITMIQAKSGKVSSLSHLLQHSDMQSKDPTYNPNLNEKNVLLFFHKEEVLKMNYLRNNRNSSNVDGVNKLVKKLDKLAREDYMQHKLKEKADNPTKKVRTVLQSKNLTKEFIISFGSTSRNEVMAMGRDKIIEHIQHAALAVLGKKGLDKTNIHCIAVHFDERGLPHGHVQYCDYSFKHHTTCNQLEKCITDGKPDHAKRKALYSEYQTAIAEATGLERGAFGGVKSDLSVDEIRAKLAKGEIIKDIVNALKDAEECLFKDVLNAFGGVEKVVSDKVMEKVSNELESLKNKPKQR
jgi:hypothetical protein